MIALYPSASDVARGKGAQHVTDVKNITAQTAVLHVINAGTINVISAYVVDVGVLKSAINVGRDVVRTVCLLVSGDSRRRMMNVMAAVTISAAVLVQIQKNIQKNPCLTKVG